MVCKQVKSDCIRQYKCEESVIFSFDQNVKEHIGRYKIYYNDIKSFYINIFTCISVKMLFKETDCVHILWF